MYERQIHATKLFHANSYHSMEIQSVNPVGRTKSITETIIQRISNDCDRSRLGQTISINGTCCTLLGSANKVATARRGVIIFDKNPWANEL